MIDVFMRRLQEDYYSFKLNKDEFRLKRNRYIVHDPLKWRVHFSSQMAYQWIGITYGEKWILCFMVGKVNFYLTIAAIHVESRKYLCTSKENTRSSILGNEYEPKLAKVLSFL